MIRSLEDGVTAFPHYDICIVGAGPAGITVCAELIGSGFRICVLESGTETKMEFADSLRKVQAHGIGMLPDSRERILGGATHTWSGLCAPLDPVDFVTRGWPYHSGWPITWDELSPYYERSAERYGFPRLNTFTCSGPFVDNASGAPRWQNCEEKVFLKPANILRFGPKFKHVFLQKDVDLILGATVVDLPADGSRENARVTAALCRDEKSRTLLITADRFVLAAGAIDNARLLLNSKSIVREGLGNERDQVGRYLMNHPSALAGAIRLRESAHWLGRYAFRPCEGGTGFVGVRLRESQQLKEDVLNSYVRLLPHYPWTGRPEIRTWREFVGRARAWLNGRSLGGRSHLKAGRDLARAACRAFVSTPGLLRLIVLRLMRHFRPGVRMIGMLNFVEMEPRPENRITLTDDRDALDMPVPRVVHQLSQRDLQSLHCLQEQIAADLETMGCGHELVGTTEELANAEWVDSYHYLGTTRMGAKLEHSVVNSDLRVHTVNNLYVAGGSVFPTSGCANPTMTIVALSIRLAEHLRITRHEVNGRQTSMAANAMGR
jgi:choline dehydrogenase-like flavoprotein